MERDRQRIAERVSARIIIGNVFLFLLKLIGGIRGHSAAMISDAVHSLADVVSTLIVIIGVRLAGKAADREHPYGHERMECVAAIILAAVLGATGVGIGYSGLYKMVRADYAGDMIPGTIALGAALISIVLKETMYWYTRTAAKKINSSVMMADAWHHRSDALSSVGSLAGIIGARMGYPVFDAVACLLISVLVVKAAVDIFADAVNKIIDRACDEATMEAIRKLILSNGDIIGIDVMRTRMFGDKIYVDVEIVVEGQLSLCESHAIAHLIHDEVENVFKEVKHCMIHVNPGTELKASE